MKKLKANTYIVFITSLICISGKLTAQLNIEDLDCGPDPNGMIQTYWDIDTYKPMMDGQFLHDCPLTTIDLNFNIWQRSDGSGNFQNTPEDKAALLEVLDMINDRYAHYGPSDPVIDPEDELPGDDSRLRFSLGDPGEERIYFYQDTPSTELYCCTDGYYFISYLQDEYPERLEQLNVFFVGGFLGADLTEENIDISNGGSGYITPPEVHFNYSICGGFGNVQANSEITNGSITDIHITSGGIHSMYGCAPEISFEGGGGTGATAYCTLTGGWGGQALLPSENLNQNLYFVRVGNTGENPADEGMAVNLTHELAHNLDLTHTYNSSPCVNDDDYLSDVFGPWSPDNPNCPHNHDCDNAYLSQTDLCTNNIMGGEDTKYISPRQAGIMHRSLALLSTRKYVNDDVFINSAPLVISNNQTWDFNIKLYRDIIIESGVTLTITCKVVMPWQGQIFVKPAKQLPNGTWVTGGKLIIDGGTITTESKNHLWGGIEVWGNSNKHQYEINNLCYQGQIILKNGATVENASTGVYLGGFQPNGQWDLSKDGGIIQCLQNNSVTEPGAKFINNMQAVQFQEYENYNPNNFADKKPNRSYFTNVLFEVNDNFKLQQIWDKSHILLYGVSGVVFNGCTFTNATQTTNKGTGIYCAPGPGKWLGCGFKALSICSYPISPCPEGALDCCRFENLEKGIVAINTGIYTINVENAIFTNNSYGIKMTNVNNASILFSEFELGQASEKELENCGSKATAFGIFMDNCTGFAIEENHFTKAQGAPTGTFTGIYIAETQAADQVYKNYFDGLSYGNYAVGKNWKQTYTWQGLAYYCNENTGNWKDFNIIKNSQVPPIGGIQNPIGSTQMTAGNTFSEFAVSNFYNMGDYWISYYYYAPSPGNTNTPYFPDAVYRIYRYEVVGVQNQCLSHYSGGGGGSERELVLTPDQKQQTEFEFVSNLSDYNNVNDLYENLKDGGNTSATVDDIEAAWPQDMWELRSELLGKSPHLSMEVLKTAADKTEVLPESVIFDIMAANPDELKKDELIKYLEDKENPLPSYMIDILKQVAAGTTYKTVLMQQMANYNQTKTRAGNDIIRSLLNDTILNYTELRNWFDNIGGKRADEQIIASYMSEGNFDDAISLANIMPSLYNYSGNELTEHNYFTYMLNLQKNLAQQVRTIFELDSTEVANLEFIAENSKGTAGAQAKGILEFAYGHHYCNCVEGDTSGYKNSENFNYNAFSKVFGTELEVKPNPAGEWTTFNYSFPTFNSDGVIKISDVAGKLIESFTVSGKNGQKLWDTRKINSGVYFYNFEANGFSKSGKIIISK